MNWPFEHWYDGKVYLHNENWAEFRKNIEKCGYKDSLHDWNHNRIFLNIHTPRDFITDIPVLGDDELKHKIIYNREWSVIYDLFPAYKRTENDPEGWLPSYNLWVEDKHADKEKISILETGHIYSNDAASRYSLLGLSTKPIKNLFAIFQDKFWKIDSLITYGTGPNPPPVSIKSPRKKYRSIFDD